MALIQLEKKSCTDPSSNSGLRNISAFERYMGDPGWIPLFLIYIKELSEFLLLRVFFQSSYRANLKVQMAIKVEEGLSKSVKSGNTLFSVKEL